MAISFVNVKPSIENVDPFRKYQQSTPSTFSLQENPILYGGGRNWKFTILNNSSDDNNNTQPQQPSMSSLQKQLSEKGILIPEAGLIVDVFVLNSCLILWLNAADFGIELSYQQVILHALHKNKDNRSLLYLQLKDDDEEEELIEAELIPVSSTNTKTSVSSTDNTLPTPETTSSTATTQRPVDDNNSSNNINNAIIDNGSETLFTSHFFGPINHSDKLVENTFSALSKCSAFHFDPDSDINDETHNDNNSDEANQGIFDFPIIDNTGSLNATNNNDANDNDDDNDDNDDDDDVLINTAGQADDIDVCNDDSHSIHGSDSVRHDAALEVKIQNAGTGTVRQRDDDGDEQSSENQKVRRL